MTRWLVALTTGLLIIALGVVFLLIGLSRADQLASTVGALVGLAGLGLAAWAAIPTRARSTGQSAGPAVAASDGPTSADPTTPDGTTWSSAAANDAESADPGSDVQAKYRVDVRHGRGVQIGDNSTQNNTYY